MPGKGGENTSCPSCGEVLIKRFGYRILDNRIAGGSCPKCSTVIEGVWG